MLNNLTAPELLRKSRQLRRTLSEQASLREIRIAVLGGVTTSELTALLELLLLAEGFRPVFHESDYNRYYEEAVLETERLREFRPNFVYLCTHWNNVRCYPRCEASESEFQALLDREAARFRAMWSAIEDHTSAQIIQNNHEAPAFPLLGNLDCVSYGGPTRFIHELNREFARAANADRRLLIHDLNSLSAHLGQAQWFDWKRWYSYKIATTPEASLAIAKSLAAMIGASLGRSRKCLVLDLDNTLWGGVIGDDGADKIQIGKETAVAEAYTAFQEYCLALRQRGVVLAVCSKNNEENARSGFAHPESVLKLEHFAAFKANWETKHENIKAIAAELNLGLDSIVFVDDNPAERAIVAAQLPMVGVPDVGSDVAEFPGILQRERYFETVSLSREDLQRAESYSANSQRAGLQAKFADYGEYLDSLQMTAEIATFRSVYLERITQLINKSNQFNLTTRRYTLTEIETIAADSNYIGLYGKLGDTFGDNGLISVIIGRRNGPSTLHIELWIMSCRVLKREMELAMLDELVEHARAAGVAWIFGYFRRSAKNGMVQEHYSKLGFEPVSSAEDGSESVWRLGVTGYERRTSHILVNRGALAVGGWK